MSGDLYAKPGTTNQVYCEQDDKDSMVNIYVSAESLRVYDKPWVEDTSPNTGPAEAQLPVVLENSGKRKHVRCDSVFLGALCLLLLVGIICLWVKMNKDKASWSGERKQLLAEHTELCRETHDLWRKFCRQNPMKCKRVDRLAYP